MTEEVRKSTDTVLTGLILLIERVRLRIETVDV